MNDWEMTWTVNFDVDEEVAKTRGLWPDEIIVAKWEQNRRGERRIAEEQRYVIDRPKKQRKWSDPTVPK